MPAFISESRWRAGRCRRSIGVGAMINRLQEAGERPALAERKCVSEQQCKTLAIVGLRQRPG
jgi:hypothetical protein